MAANVMLGPYDIRHYRFQAVSIYTNKSPVGPYRGVGRPGGCFAMERIVDEVAHFLGMDQADVRRRNTDPRGKNALRHRDGPGLRFRRLPPGGRRSGRSHVRAHWTARPPPGPRRRVGIGYATLVEQAGHGSEEWFRRGSPTVYGHEAARASLNGDGTLEIDVGTLAHGQGHATSYAQIAAQITGIPLGGYPHTPGRHRGHAPTAWATVASRSIVMGGGAVAQACAALIDKARRIAAANLGDAPAALAAARCRPARRARQPDAGGDIAHFHRADTQVCPRTSNPACRCSAFYRPSVETGTFSYAAHAARVEVDVDTGFVGITDYLVVEDCGTVVNPLVADGQVVGGVAQGIGQALYEAMRQQRRRPTADGDGSATTSMPSAMEVPDIDIIHLCTPSPFSAFGVKSMSEGGSVPPPAAIANAVRAALRERDVAVDQYLHRTRLSADAVAGRPEGIVKLPDFDYRAPETLDAALQMLAALGSDAARCWPAARACCRPCATGWRVRRCCWTSNAYPCCGHAKRKRRPVHRRHDNARRSGARRARQPATPGPSSMSHAPRARPAHPAPHETHGTHEAHETHAPLRALLAAHAAQIAFPAVRTRAPSAAALSMRTRRATGPAVLCARRQRGTAQPARPARNRPERIHPGPAHHGNRDR